MMRQRQCTPHPKKILNSLRSSNGRTAFQCRDLLRQMEKMGYFTDFLKEKRQTKIEDDRSHQSGSRTSVACVIAIFTFLFLIITFINNFRNCAAHGNGRINYTMSVFGVDVWMVHK